MYIRLCFGIASSPGVFQRIIDQLIQGIPKVAYLDDLLISGQMMEEHNSNHRAVLTRLRDVRLRLRGNKCEFKNLSILYLSHWTDAEEIHPNKEKAIAIPIATNPTNVSKLLRF